MERVAIENPSVAAEIRILGHSILGRACVDILHGPQAINDAIAFRVRPSGARVARAICIFRTSSYSGGWHSEDPISPGELEIEVKPNPRSAFDLVDLLREKGPFAGQGGGGWLVMRIDAGNEQQLTAARGV
ncbi:MAG: hypothetical protein WD645_01795, partial [Dehalococcoidia bacterium]